jgi:hypothetical protein
MILWHKHRGGMEKFRSNMNLQVIYLSSYHNNHKLQPRPPLFVNYVTSRRRKMATKPVCCAFVFIR